MTSEGARATDAKKVPGAGHADPAVLALVRGQADRAAAGLVPPGWPARRVAAVGLLVAAVAVVDALRPAAGPADVTAAALPAADDRRLSARPPTSAGPAEAAQPSPDPARADPAAPRERPPLAARPGDAPPTPGPDPAQGTAAAPAPSATPADPPPTPADAAAPPPTPNPTAGPGPATPPTANPPTTAGLTPAQPSPTATPTGPPAFPTTAQPAPIPPRHRDVIRAFFGPTVSERR